MANDLTYSYDKTADVLYITKGKSRTATHSKGGYGGCLLRSNYDEPLGVTIMHFNFIQAATDEKMLEQVAYFLKVNKTSVQYIFNSAN